ncbi:MAG: serine hydrolase [Akkermansiaceae bacterium]|nr:serine hydrolase [Akkermansiaceae bacterium]
MTFRFAQISLTLSVLAFASLGRAQTFQGPGGPAQSDRESVMVMEAFSGKVLLASNSTRKQPVASLTKIATAVVALDWAAASGSDIAKVQLLVPSAVTRVGGPNPMNLKPGERIVLRDALYAMMLSSDNLAALTVADHVGRQLLISRAKRGEPVKEFVDEMNHLAKGLGMKDTRFANPHGIDREGVKQFSTAADVARLSVYAMRLNPLSFIVRQPSRQISVTGTEGSRSYMARNTNDLLGEAGVVGLKTGTTQAAGPCLATSVYRDPLVRRKADGSKGATPRRLIVVVLNSPDRFGNTRSYIKRGWAIYDAWLARGAPVDNAKRELIKVPSPIDQP